MSIPVSTACSGVEICRKLDEGDTPIITISLKVDLPVKELITALTSLENLQPPPPAKEVPDCCLRSIPTAVPVSQVDNAFMPPPQVPTSKFEIRKPTAEKWEAAPVPKTAVVRVSNLVKRLQAEKLQQLFEVHVGPVMQCTVVEKMARIAFFSDAHAQEAIHRYNGGILEVGATTRTEESLVLHEKANSVAELEDCLGALSSCHVRRGRGWMTIFHTATIKDLKKDSVLSHIGYKGSFISITADGDALDSWMGMVVGEPVEL